MSHRVPSIDVFRSVENVTEEDVAYMERDVNARSGGMHRKKVADLFSRGLKLPLRATLVQRSELMKFQQFAERSHEVDQSHIEELAAYIGTILPDFSENPHQVSTLPSSVYGKDAEAVLTVGSDLQLRQERILAKHAIHTFYDVEEVPDGVWDDDQLRASVRVVRGKKADERRSVTRMHNALMGGARLLPTELELSPVEIQLSR